MSGEGQHRLGQRGDSGPSVGAPTRLQTPPPAHPAAVPPGLLERPRRRGSALFTVTVAILLLLGAGVMCLVLVLANAPGALAVGVVLAALPVGPVVASLPLARPLRARAGPAPGARVLLGRVVATAAALVLQALDQAVLGTPDDWSAAIVAPITEEGAKGLFILLLLWFRRRVIDGVLDGIVYAGLVGVGFAFTENILYLAGAYMGDDGLGSGGSAPRRGCSSYAASSAPSRTRCSRRSSGSASASPSSRRTGPGGSSRRSSGTSLP